MRRSCRRQALNSCKKLFEEGNVLNEKETLFLIVEIVLLLLFFAYFFYQTLWVAVFLFPIGLMIAKQKIKKQKRRKQEQIRNQFKDAIMGISANLRAGYSVENAFRESVHEMQQLYGKEAEIYKALYMIVQGISNNVSLEVLLKHYAEQTQVEEIQEFADVFGIAKKMGGNLTEIIGETANVIGEKIEVNREIQVVLAEKQLEQKVMNVIPFAIVLYIMLVSEGYFDVLYHSTFGVGVMTVCLILYFTAYFWGQKLVEIQI
ncbi:MAG: type II secretion system protein F [Lachnospiraceae bacterium]|nr:type II secretion system protein F [Lachnospiraceae bacterium]